MGDSELRLFDYAFDLLRIGCVKKNCGSTAIGRQTSEAFLRRCGLRRRRSRRPPSGDRSVCPEHARRPLWPARRRRGSASGKQGFCSSSRSVWRRVPTEMILGEFAVGERKTSFTLKSSIFVVMAHMVMQPTTSIRSRF
jgi:hypothetical protein